MIADSKAESRLRLKIDFYVLPTIALLYLFCFIDRANIGTPSPQPPMPIRTHGPRLTLDPRKR